MRVARNTISIELLRFYSSPLIVTAVVFIWIFIYLFVIKITKFYYIQYDTLTHQFLILFHKYDPNLPKEIKENYEKKVGPEVTVNIREVDEIKNEENSRKPAPIVVTKVKLEEGFKRAAGFWRTL